MIKSNANRNMKIYSYAVWNSRGVVEMNVNQSNMATNEVKWESEEKNGEFKVKAVPLSSILDEAKWENEMSIALHCLDWQWGISQRNFTLALMVINFYYD